MKRPDKQTLLNLYRRDGLTDAQIAERFGVTPSTVWRWRQHHGIKIHVSQVYKVRVRKG